MSKISIVVPVYNEQEVISRFHETASRELREKMPSHNYELVYVNDGSSDGTRDALSKIYEADQDHVVLINFVRNFGQVPALLAGLRHATGSCAVIISADLQDPPSLIPELVREWENNHKLVLAARQGRQDDFLSKITSKIFYSLMGRFANPHIPRGGFDFFLVDRAIINHMVGAEEQNCFLQGLVLWPGYPPKYLYYERQKRELGKSHWSFLKKFKYFIDGFTAYSLFPIRLVAVTGCVLFAAGFLVCLAALLINLFQGRPAANGTWLFFGLCVLGGLQMIGMGILGEYLWRALEQVRKRPLFVIDNLLKKSTGETK